MELLPRPVTNRTRPMPDCLSSSATYCTIGFLPTGSISFGCDLVAGSNLVPNPAIGITALVMATLIPLQQSWALCQTPGLLTQQERNWKAACLRRYVDTVCKSAYRNSLST